MGSVSPTMGSASPSVDNFCPFMGSASLSIDKICPFMGSASPTLGTTSPSTVSATSRVRKSSPSNEVRVLTVEERVPINGLRDLVAEDKPATVTTVEASRRHSTAGSSGRPESLRLLRIRLIAVLHRGIDVRLLQLARGLRRDQLVQELVAQLLVFGNRVRVGPQSSLHSGHDQIGA
jgi:hypothetical protein